MIFLVCGNSTAKGGATGKPRGLFNAPAFSPKVLSEWRALYSTGFPCLSKLLNQIFRPSNTDLQFHHGLIMVVEETTREVFKQLCFMSFMRMKMIRFMTISVVGNGTTCTNRFVAIAKEE